MAKCAITAIEWVLHIGLRADGKKEGEEPWKILCCRRTRMDDRLPPGKEKSQCSAGRTEDQI